MDLEERLETVHDILSQNKVTRKLSAQQIIALDSIYEFAKNVIETEKSGQSKGEQVKLKGDKVDISFRIDKDLSKDEKDNIIYDVMNEINDRMMYVTEVKINDVTIFGIDK